MPSSMILRFRDLAGPIGSTVERHSAIITAQGSAWWAWWCKPNERIPRALFAQFKEAIQRDGYLDVYLADSGRYLLYRARLVEIRESPTEEPISSPDEPRTPEYYRSTPYKAWFRLASIESVPPPAIEHEVRSWSYDEVQNFTDDPFVASFQDKQLFSIQEVLHRRHRTIYFIQPYQRGHRTHQVEALPRVQPQNFIAEPIMASSSFVLHLSDLHFGPEHGFALSEGAPGRRSLARALIDDLRTGLRSGAPALVLVTGDLTWRGEQPEFKQANEFLERLRSEFSLETSHFIVVPGNHDIRWSSDPAAKDSAVQYPPTEAKENFRRFYEDFSGVPPNQHFSQGRRVLLANFQTIDVIGVSSAELEQQKFAGYGYVSAEQLRDAMSQMGWDSAGTRTAYRIVALHHHVTPIAPEEEIASYDKNYSITLDAGHLIYECLAAGVDLVVHGHQHQPFTGMLARTRGGDRFSSARTVVVNACGSTGVRKERIPSGRNAFAIYEIEPDTINIRVRRTSDVRVGFDDAPEWGTRLRRNPAGGMLLSVS